MGIDNPIGLPGIQGPQGVQGPQGPQGDPAFPPYATIAAMQTDTVARTGFVYVGNVGVYTVSSAADYDIAPSGSGVNYYKVVPLANGDWPVKAFGATGNGTTLDSTAIQNAIERAYANGGGNVVFFPGTFLLDVVTYTKDDGVTVSGVTSLKLRDGVYLKGAPGATTLKTKNAGYGAGAFYRMISSHDAPALSNGGLFDLILDGNKANQTASTQCNNVLLTALANITIERVQSINSNGNGIQVVGTTAAPVQNLKIGGCIENNANYIGIQVSQFNGVVIESNSVNNPANNCVDLYGEAGVGVNSNGKNFVVNANTLIGGTVSIFPETCGDGVVSNNVMESASDCGMVFNRINSVVHDLLFSGNEVRNCPTGFRGTGDTKGVTVRGNHFSGFTVAGVQLGRGNGNCSYVEIADNSFIPATDTTPIFVIGSSSPGAVSFSSFERSKVLTSTYALASAFSFGTATRNKVWLEPPVRLDTSYATVTQATSKETAVTINSQTGIITTNNEALNGNGAETAFVVNNSFVGAGDIVMVNPTGTSSYETYTTAVNNGTFVIRLKNITGGSLSDAVQIAFRVLKVLQA